MKRQAKKILPTMKLKCKKETDIPFEEIQVEFLGIDDVETEKYGSKQVARLKDNDDREFSVFVNNYSMQNLIDAWGEEDKHWPGKLVQLKKETDAQFDNEMIVLHPVK